MPHRQIIVSDAVRAGRVLIVDDTEFNRVIIHDILLSVGFHNVEAVASGDEALAACKKFVPDIFILDLMMPDMDGFELCRRIRALPVFSETPIIVQTAMSEADQRLKVFQLGANDLITKPIHPLELVSRVKLHLEHYFANKAIMQSQERLNQELHLAREMQMGLFPTDDTLKNLIDSHALVVNHFVQPSSEIGGDLWGISPIDDHRVAVYMFDIAGHGVSAAINAFRIHSLLNLHTLHVHNPSMFLDKLNKRLCNLFQPGQYATIFLGVLDTTTNVLTFAAAASPQPLIIRHDGTSIWLDNEGYPLGVISTADFPEQAVKLLPGDTLFLYSDALIESPCAKTNAFLSEQEIELALHTELAGKEANANIQTEKQLRFMLEMIKKLGVRAGTPLRDDLTMTLITRLVASDPA